MVVHTLSHPWFAPKDGYQVLKYFEIHLKHLIQLSQAQVERLIDEFHLPTQVCAPSIAQLASSSQGVMTRLLSATAMLVADTVTSCVLE